MNKNVVIKTVIDLNADVGEYADEDARRVEAELLTIVSSCSIACGGHAGDAETMLVTARLANENGVAIGAHPSYPDREGFGRRALKISVPTLKSSLEKQIETLLGVLEEEHIPLRHLKLHGALYNIAARHEDMASVAAALARTYDLVLFGPPDSSLERAANRVNVLFAAEGFIDRGYLADGSLIPRDEPGAIIDTIKARAKQAVAIAKGETITVTDGVIKLTANTLCIHSDSPDAIETARAARTALEASAITIRPFCKS